MCLSSHFLVSGSASMSGSRGSCLVLSIHKTSRSSGINKIKAYQNPLAISFTRSPVKWEVALLLAQPVSRPQALPDRDNCYFQQCSRQGALPLSSKIRSALSGRKETASPNGHAPQRWARDRESREGRWGQPLWVQNILFQVS